MATGLLKYSAPSLPAALAGWTLPGVRFRVSHTNVGSALTDVPILIVITDNEYFAQAQSAGQDVRFTDADGNVLPHQKITFAIADGVADGAYIVVCDLSNTEDTDIFGYCGNDEASDTSTTDVWNSNYKGVWMLRETATGAAGDYQDWTANNNDSVNTSSEPSAISGPVTGIGASDFNGSTQVQIADGVSVGGTGLTLEGIFRVPAFTTDKAIFARRQPDSVQITTQSGGNLRASLWLAGSETFFTTTDANLSTDTWYYFALTYDGANVTIRVYSSAGQVKEQSWAETRSISSNTSYTHFAHDSWNATTCKLAFWRLSNTTRAEDLLTFTASQLLVTGSQITVSDVVGAWEAVGDAEITGEMVLACDAATTTTIVWAEIEDPEDCRQIWDGTAYVDRYTLADSDAWRECLIPVWHTSLADGTVGLRCVGQIPAALNELPWRARFLAGESPTPGMVLCALQEGQPPADATIRWPQSDRRYAT